MHDASRVGDPGVLLAAWQERANRGGRCYFAFTQSGRPVACQVARNSAPVGRRAAAVGRLVPDDVRGAA